ncbi:MAG: metallophosphoesterase [Deltaproteobacteria bacterium]|nr:metallophosphoesterase [Deltaproteobacteria bacterium]
MIKRITRRQFLICLALVGARTATGNISFASVKKGACFSFAVLSDPHSTTDSWINALTEARDLKINPPPEYGHPDFLLITGDTNPIDVNYEGYNTVFKSSDKKPIFLPVIGNHEADDSGGFPGMGPMGMGIGMPPQGQEGMQPGMGMPEGAGGPADQGGQSGMGGPQDMGRGSDGTMTRAPGNPQGRYPDIGDKSIIDMEFIRDKIISSIPGIVRISENSCTYYYDHENIRVISVDAYSGEAGTGGVIDDNGRKWTEDAIKSAPSSIDHIFIAFHAPAFPRVRHTHDSFNADPEQRNAFWNMLVSHKDKVKAAFCGHSHHYARMRVLDPAGTAANDLNAYPDEEGGIYHIDSGSTGNGRKNTFVRVMIEGKNIYFRAYEAENGKDKPFALKDEWGIIK